MAKQAINVGTQANDGTGDPLRAALDKCNDNFDEIYALTDGTGAASVLTLAAGTATLGDTTISDATPVLIFKDSSCTDADNNATFAVNATATGTGAENVDVTLSQQVSGASTTFLNADADGSITLGDATRTVVLSGAVTVSGIATLSATAPTLQFKDSDCADADVNASIAAAATTTTSAHEDVDVTFSQQVDGTPTAFLVADADGSLTLGQSGQAIVLNGPVGDTIFRSATPTLSFKDSSCADADVNADLVVSATNTGSGTENVDVTFGQQVAGTKVSFLVATAGGSLALGYSGQTVYAAKLAHGTTVVPVTTTAAPASTATGTVYTNEGDADGATVTLPAAAAGLQFSVVVQAAQTLTVTAGAGDTIRVAAGVTAAAGSITCATVGSAITLVAINADEWVALSTVGTWTVSE